MSGVKIAKPKDFVGDVFGDNGQYKVYATFLNADQQNTFAEDFMFLKKGDVSRLTEVESDGSVKGLPVDRAGAWGRVGYVVISEETGQVMQLGMDETLVGATVTPNISIE
jgi:hypothetical protein